VNGQRLMPLIALLFAAGCVTAAPTQTTSRRVSADLAVELSSEFLARQGIVHIETESVEELRPNYFRIRFGLAPHGSGRIIDAYFDGTRREVVKTEDERGIVGTPTAQSPTRQ